MPLGFLVFCGFHTHTYIPIPLYYLHSTKKDGDDGTMELTDCIFKARAMTRLRQGETKSLCFFSILGSMWDMNDTRGTKKMTTAYL